MTISDEDDPGGCGRPPAESPHGCWSRGRAGGSWGGVGGRPRAGADSEHRVNHEGHESSAHRGMRVRVRLPSTAASTAGWKPRMRPCGGTALCAGSGRGTGEAIDAMTRDACVKGGLSHDVFSSVFFPVSDNE